MPHCFICREEISRRAAAGSASKKAREDRKIDIESCHCEQSEAISQFPMRLPRPDFIGTRNDR